MTARNSILKVERREGEGEGKGKGRGISEGKRWGGTREHVTAVLKGRVDWRGRVSGGEGEKGRVR